MNIKVRISEKRLKKLIDLLCETGLVTEEAHPEDKRTKAIYTPRGVGENSKTVSPDPNTPLDYVFADSELGEEIASPKETKEKERYFHELPINRVFDDIREVLEYADGELGDLAFLREMKKRGHNPRDVWDLAQPLIDRGLLIRTKTTVKLGNSE